MQTSLILDQHQTILLCPPMELDYEQPGMTSKVHSIISHCIEAPFWSNTKCFCKQLCIHYRILAPSFRHGVPISGKEGSQGKKIVAQIVTPFIT
jgi:hypothetical protein